jgi:hypothetical protein
VAVPEDGKCIDSYVTSLSGVKSLVSLTLLARHLAVIRTGIMADGFDEAVRKRFFLFLFNIEFKIIILLFFYLECTV